MPHIRISHAPSNYQCAFCGIVSRAGAPPKDEVVFHDEVVTAFISSHQWPNNRGHALVIPNEHFENLYELPDHLAVPLQVAVRRIALALRSAYSCEGTSTRQHNEPAGNQDVWHYHVHVFPRYSEDRLYQSPREPVALDLRLEQAARLRRALASLAVT